MAMAASADNVPTKHVLAVVRLKAMCDWKDLGERCPVDVLIGVGFSFDLVMRKALRVTVCRQCKCAVVVLW